MISDQGPKTNLGFGIPLQNSDNEQGPPANASFIQKRLAEKPVLSFLATGAASIISMHLAGKMVRSGGLRLGYGLQQAAKGTSEIAPLAQTAVQSIRQLRTYLDTLEGVSRDLIDPDDLSKLVKRERIGSGGKGRYKYSGERTHVVDNFYIRAGRIKDGDSVEEWTTRDAIQQRLVSQVRRLPYELPALYMAEKAIIDPIFNKDPSKKPVNFSNPVDLIGDFAYSSVKNLATAVLPYEIGFGFGGSQYQKFMAQSSKFFSGPQQDEVNGLGILTLRTIISQVAASAGDMLDKAARYSNQTAGAMSAFVQDSLGSGLTFSQWIKTMNTQAAKNSQVPNAGFARKSWEFAKEVVKKDSLEKHLDALPGPFRGAGSAFGTARRAFKETGETYDDWQSVVSGMRKLGSLSQERQDKVLEFMRRGGQTRVEEYATQMSQMGKGGRFLPGSKVENAEWRKGLFYDRRRQDKYKSLLASNLENIGLDAKNANKFVNSASVITPFSKTKHKGIPGNGLAERIRFSTGKYTGDEANDDWFNWLKETTGKADINFGDVTYDKFHSAVMRTDAIFQTRGFRQRMDEEVENQWNFIHDRIMPRFGGDIITTNRRPYEEFEGTIKSAQRDFLVRRTAQRLDIQTTDNAGQLIPDAILKDQIRAKGLDPTKLHTLKGYLISKGDIAKPWSISGANLLGIRSVGVKEAWDNDYFAGNNVEVKNEIAHIVNSRRFGYQLPNTSQALKLRGVYRTANGRVLDTGRIMRGLSRVTDRLADDVQIPLIHIRPLNLLGHGVRKEQRQKAVIQYASGRSSQPFMRAETGPDPDFHLWVKTSSRGSKGKVISISGGSGSLAPSAIEHSGTYSPFPTDAYSMLGKHARIAHTDMGAPNSDHRGKEQKWRKRFDLSQDQSESLYGLAKRTKQFIRGDREARKNSRRAAEWFARDFDPAKFGAEETEGFYNLQRSLKNYGFSRRLVAKLSDNKQFSDFFEVSVPGGVKKVNDITDTELPRIIKSVLDEDIIKLGRTPQAAELKRLQGNLINILEKGAEHSDYFSRITPQAMRSVGVSRRIDELRNEFYKYTAIKSQMGGVGGSQTFNSNIQNLLSEVESMAGKGVISKAEKSEARAAILGIQIEYFTNKAYREIVENQVGTTLGAVPSKIASKTLETMLDPAEGGLVSRELLGEFAKRDPSASGKIGVIKNIARRKIGMTPYDEGVQWNPFGSEVAFVPSFKTAFERDPLAATSSVLGFNTWSNQQAFSGASVVPSHLVYRLNRYFETFNMGIDPSNYKGPLDFYARGMVGKRVFPLVAGATTATMVDRQLGGMVKEDENGDPIYSPLIMGLGADAIAQTQVGLAGLIPGGQTAEEKRYELESGEVPIRAGRYWPLGNTPFKGGRIQYFRPSWYQRFKSGGTFIPEKNETPLERLAFGYDFSPLRPLDPYRFERENKDSRPYPVSGDYFSGPWGPLTGVLNATAGRVLKPRRDLHEEAVQYGLQQYMPVGEAGAYMSTTPITGVPQRYTSNQAVAGSLGAINASYAAGAGGGGGTPFYSNLGLSPGRGRGSALIRENASILAASYSRAAQNPGSYVDVWTTLVPYGVPAGPGQMAPRVVASAEPMNPGSLGFQSRKIGYQSQELMGIYGFGLANIRSSLGLGSGDLTPVQAVLEPANRGYSASRSFWGMNLGGLGDLPLPIEGNFANLEISEIVRRFVPKEQSGMNYINPIPNLMGKQYPWLPGINYPINPLKTGDPYGQMPDAEIRLPGTGYARTHQMLPDQFGQLGVANIHDILGDVAPWSQEYRAIDNFVGGSNLTEMQRAKIEQTRAQVDAMRMKEEFTPYEYKYRDPLEVVEHPLKTSLGRGWEWLAHRDTYVNTKFLPVRTAVEDWERDNVYGATFPTWQNPIQSFLEPMANKASQRNPVLAGLSLGAVGSLFGVSPQAKAFGGLIGGTVGLGISSAHRVREAITGERFIPEDRRKELALEEYTDILSYTRAARLASQATQRGDQAAAAYFDTQAKKTMFGVDLNSTPEQIAMALPKRKREHFRSMLYAPKEEREQILSTAGRLERRIYQAAWGMPVEQRPDLAEYFTEHELPPPDAELWSPLLNMDTIKIKVGQSLGLDMAQMGFYPQQIKEANLINPSYPDMFGESSRESVQAQLRRLMFNSQINGSVRAIPTPFPGTRVQLTTGVY